MKYNDVTSEYIAKKRYQLRKQKYFIDDNGIKYNVDGKHIIFNPAEKEIKIARILGEILGGQVNIIPRINEPPNIKTPDYIINNEKFDLKVITGGGKYVIEGNLRGKKGQAENFVIDITNAKIDIEEVEKQIRSIYISKRYLWINKIFIIRENKVIKVYARNR